jgi:hypothetical protein
MANLRRQSQVATEQTMTNPDAKSATPPAKVDNAVTDLLNVQVVRNETVANNYKNVLRELTRLATLGVLKPSEIKKYVKEFEKTGNAMQTLCDGVYNLVAAKKQTLNNKVEEKEAPQVPTQRPKL